MLNEKQLNAALLDLFEYGWIFLGTQDHAEQVLQAVPRMIRRGYEITQDGEFWRVAIRPTVTLH